MNFTMKTVFNKIIDRYMYNKKSHTHFFHGYTLHLRINNYIFNRKYSSYLYVIVI